MDSGLVTVGTNADMFNQLLSPAFNTPDPASTTQFLGSFGLSPEATQSAAVAALSGANPFAAQGGAAPGLLNPMGGGAIAGGLASAGGLTAPGAGAPVSADALGVHPALVAAVANYFATGGAPVATASPVVGSPLGYGAAAPTSMPTGAPIMNGAPAGVSSIAPPPGAPTTDPAAAAAPGAAGAPEAGAAAGGGAAPATEYEVKSGDSLSAIAKKHGIGNWREIYNIPENKALIGDNPNLIKVGIKLKLPGGAAGAAGAATPAASGPLTPEQRTQKQAELTKLDAEIETARKGLMDIYATIQPGSTPEQRADAERRTAEAQTKLDQMMARQTALRTELGMPASGASATDAASFGMPAGTPGIPTVTATSAA